MKSKHTALDPIRAFYITQEFLPKIAKQGEMSAAKLEKALQKAVKEAEKVTDKALLMYHLDNWHQRYDNYVNSEWELKEVALADCGAWPGMGGLPKEFTIGSVVDTADAIRPFLEDKSKLTWKTARALYVEEMQKCAELITSYVPIVVLEDGVIRNNKLEAEKGVVYKKCVYDIDDGNHRAIALALMGKKKIKAWVGKRVYKNSLVY